MSRTVKPPTIDAQDLKKALELAAKKIGKRKRMRAGAFFELIISSKPK